MGNIFAFEKEPDLYPDFAAKLPRQDGKIVVITGCTTGTGYVAAKLSAEKGAHVLMLNRPSERSKKAFEEVKAVASPEAKVTSIDCDLSDFESVKKAAGEVKAAVPQLDVLCNNAGVMAFPDQGTKDGYDIQMQTNHLAHFMLTRELFPLLEKAAAIAGEARIVNHSSLARERMKKLEKEYFGKNSGNLGGDEHGTFMDGPRWKRYQQTKLANVVFTNAVHKKLEAQGSKIKSVSCAPGASSTALLNNTESTGELSSIMKLVIPVYAAFFIQSAEDGTMPLLTCMYDSSVKSGDFYEPADAGGMKGASRLTTLAEHCLSEQNEKVLWDCSVEACGEFPL